jgi:hypothetical protein
VLAGFGFGAFADDGIVVLQAGISSSRHRFPFVYGVKSGL